MFQVHINRNQKDQILLSKHHFPCLRDLVGGHHIDRFQFTLLPFCSHPGHTANMGQFYLIKFHLFEIFISRAISSRQLHQPLSQNPKGCRRVSTYQYHSVTTAQTFGEANHENIPVDYRNQNGEPLMSLENNT